jgi:hypothetical protein
MDEVKGERDTGLRHKRNHSPLNFNGLFPLIIIGQMTDRTFGNVAKLISLGRTVRQSDIYDEIKSRLLSDYAS